MWQKVRNSLGSEIGVWGGGTDPYTFGGSQREVIVDEAREVKWCSGRMETGKARHKAVFGSDSEGCAGRGISVGTTNEASRQIHKV